MRKFLTWILVFLIFSGASARSAFGWSAGAQTAKVKSLVDQLATGTYVKVRLKDHREIEGTFEARSEVGFHLDTPELTEISYSEVRSIIAEPAGQVGTNSTPGQPAKHGHLIRNVLIGLGAMFAFALVAAVAAK